jgi:hypothetical protein
MLLSMAMGGSENSSSSVEPAFRERDEEQVLTHGADSA